MRQKVGPIIVVALVAALLVGGLWFSLEQQEAISMTQVITVKQMVPLGLKLVYQGKKPKGIGSVQGFAITRKHYVIAMRPPGGETDGGETNNRLVVINRDSLEDESARYAETSTVYELGHANGMTYNAETDEILVVGIRENSEHFDGVAHVRASDFVLTRVNSLPTGTASGIACTEQGYILRSGSTVRQTDERLEVISEMALFESGLKIQDIAYRDGFVYMADWASLRCWQALLRLRLLPNQNVIYRMDLATGKVKAFLIKKPRQELESLCFAGHDCYLLMNGRDEDFYIYRVERDAAFEALTA